jgi:hypothetical protein
MSVFIQNFAGVKLAPVTSGTPGTYVDLSNHVKSVTLTRKVDQVETTAMGSLGRTYVGGLETNTVAIDFLNDDDASSVMATLNSLFATNASIKLVQTQGTVTTISATNPLYVGLCLVNSITPIAGAVGDLSMQSVTFDISGALTVSSSGTW